MANYLTNRKPEATGALATKRYDMARATADDITTQPAFERIAAIGRAFVHITEKPINERHLEALSRQVFAALETDVNRRNLVKGHKRMMTKVITEFADILDVPMICR